MIEWDEIESSLPALSSSPTWTEDRAMLGSNPSADPGAETKEARCPTGISLALTLSDQQQSDKPTVAPSVTVHLSTSAVTFTPNRHTDCP